MKAALRHRRLLPIVAAGVVAGLLAWAGPASAATAVLTKAGTLYEVSRGVLSDVDPSTDGTAAGRTPVLLLRTTESGGQPAVEMVQGTGDASYEGTESIEFDASTGTVFVVYTKFQGLMSDVHVAVRREGRWEEENIFPNVGLYLSLNPRALVTRQSFTDFDGEGGTVVKKRSILHVVWWEESGVSQARYAAIFVEDGVLRLSEVVAHNLNELAGSTVPAPGFVDLPLSSYTFPVLQRDPTTNGGVLVSFANLANLTQTVLQITFPDDMTKIAAPGATEGTPEAYARAHLPIGREEGRGRIPKQVDVNGDTEVGGVIARRGESTLFFWKDGERVRVIGTDAEETASPINVPLRPDFGYDRAVAVVKEMAEQ